MKVTIPEYWRLWILNWEVWNGSGSLLDNIAIAIIRYHAHQKKRVSS